MAVNEAQLFELTPNLNWALAPQKTSFGNNVVNRVFAKARTYPHCGSESLLTGLVSGLEVTESIAEWIVS